jgi:hypothetical protein
MRYLEVIFKGIAMRKVIVLLAGVTLAATFAGSPAQADMGCGCAKLGSAPVCVPGVSECVNKVGGVCLAPCDYQPPKKAMMKRKKKA